MQRKLYTIFGTIGILALGAGFVFLMSIARPQMERTQPNIAPPSVFYQLAAAEPMTLTVAAQGEVYPQTDISLTTQVSGKITDVYSQFVNGGAFKKGDLLLQIEDADFRAAAAGAKARLAQAFENLRREEAEAELAKREYEELGRSDAPSDLALRRPQLAQARANHDAAKAEYQAALLNLERTQVRAPFDGRVRTRRAGVGQFVAPGAELGRIFATDLAEIRLPLTDADLGRLGLPLAFVESDASPGPDVTFSAMIGGQSHRWRGRIARTEGAIDPTTRQVFAIGIVEDPYGKGAADDGTPFAVGLYVTAEIAGRPLSAAIRLPRAALHGADQVYVIKDDNSIEPRTITIASATGDEIIVTSGIEHNERIAISPLRGVAAGGKVTPLNPDGDEAMVSIEEPPTAKAGERM